MKTLSPAEIDLHNEITSAVEAHTHDANLATAIADQAITEALIPTAALLRHLAEQFDAPDLEWVGFQMWTNSAVTASYVLRRIADTMEREA